MTFFISRVQNLCQINSFAEVGTFKKNMAKKKKKYKYIS